MSLVRFRSKALGYDNCSYSLAFHEFQKTLKSACNLGKPVIRYEMSERQQFNMREWLSWWSTTLPRSGSRVRVPSRALNDTKKDIRGGYPFFVRSSPAWRKHRGLRSTPVVAKRTSTGCSATSRTLKTRNKALLFRETFLI